MLRLMRNALVLAVGLSLLALADAPATGGPPTAVMPPADQVEVAMGDYLYDPRAQAIAPGDTVRWSNVGIRNHSATSNTPLNLWDTGTIPPGGQPRSFQFLFGGTYLYHCTFHFAMTSAVAVVPAVSPPSGPVGTVFTITLAIQDAPGAFVFDVQRKDPGGQFQDWMIGVTSASVLFDSAGQVPGRYSFRSRLRRVADNVVSLYSPAVAARVTA